MVGLVDRVQLETLGTGEVLQGPWVCGGETKYSSYSVTDRCMTPARPLLLNS